MRGHTLLLLLSILAAGCAARWLPYSPVRLSAPPGDVYDRLITRARSMGYEVVERDDARRYFRVMARLDRDVVAGYGANYGRMVARVSFFGVQVNQGGGVEIAATGYHVRGSTIHAGLRDELAAFVQGLRAALV